MTFVCILNKDTGCTEYQLAYFFLTAYILKTSTHTQTHTSPLLSDPLYDNLTLLREHLQLSICH